MLSLTPVVPPAPILEKTVDSSSASFPDFAPEPTSNKEEEADHEEEEVDDEEEKANGDSKDEDSWETDHVDEGNVIR